MPIIDLRSDVPDLSSGVPADMKLAREIVQYEKSIGVSKLIIAPFFHESISLEAFLYNRDAAITKLETNEIELIPAAMIEYSDSINDDTLFALAYNNVVFVRFSFDDIVSCAQRFCDRLKRLKMRVVICCPERISGLDNGDNRLYDLVSSGAYVAVRCDGFEKGSSYRRGLFEMIQHNITTMFVTDCGNAAFDLNMARELLTKRYSKDFLPRCDEIVEKLLSNEVPEPYEPIRFGRFRLF